MAKLIYHDPKAEPGLESVFDRALMSVVAGKTVQIACPYLNLTLLRRIIERAADWRLLTDAEELLHSQTADNRKRFANFIVKHGSKIRHLPRLHAKAIVTEDKAVVGSANFTMSGITAQTEMSIMLSERTEVEELQHWFDLIWERSSEINPSELDSLVAAQPSELPSRTERLLSSFGYAVNTKLAPTIELRTGRWSESAFLGRVAERSPNLLEMQNDLIDKLKSAGHVRFHGDGQKLATYHAVTLDNEDDVLWVYENGTVYVRWTKLGRYGEDVVRSYQALWGHRVETTRPDGTAKNDGCNLAGGLNSETSSLIVANLDRLNEILSSR